MNTDSWVKNFVQYSIRIVGYIAVASTSIAILAGLVCLSRTNCTTDHFAEIIISGGILAILIGGAVLWFSFNSGRRVSRRGLMGPNLEPYQNLSADKESYFEQAKQRQTNEITAIPIFIILLIAGFLAISIGEYLK